MIWFSRTKPPVTPLLPVPPRSTLRNKPLSGRRVHLNALDPADGPDLWDAVERSRPDLSLWLPWVPFNTSLDTSQRYVEFCAQEWDSAKSLRFAIRSNETGKFLGVVSLDNCVHLHRNCDLGYWLRTESTGQGLMTEAARVCLTFGFQTLGLRRIRCAAARDNAASLRVIGKLGFQFEGYARQAELVGDRWVDHAVFSLLHQDPRP